MIDKWKKIDEYTDRLKVPGGWIVRSYDLGMQSKALHQVFISDPGHTWELNK